MNRPACISHRHHDHPKQAWCGKTTTLADWVFTDVNHAAYARLRGDRMVPCPACVAAIVAALTTTPLVKP